MTTRIHTSRILSSALLVLTTAGLACSSGGGGAPGKGSGGAPGALGGSGAGPAAGTGGQPGSGGTVATGAVGGGGAAPTGGAGPSGGAGGRPGSGGIGGAGASGGKGGSIPDGGPFTPGPAPSATEQAERDRIATALSQVATLGTASLSAIYPVSFATTLSYDPASAKNVAAIESSTLGLNAAEKQVLGKNGFVITDRQRFPTFTHGYKAIYAADLPLFVSADSILYAVHRSYDRMLQDLEDYSLVPALTSLLSGMRDALQAGTIAPLGTDTAKDIDLYLAVAQGLLTNTTPAPVAGASAAMIGQLLTEAKAATGMDYIQIFGSTRLEDFSQFTPRGHYVNIPPLSQYFQAMMWLGRLDMRMIDVNEQGLQRFDRRQFDAALGMATLWSAGNNRAQWQIMDSALDLFVGEPDSMQPTEFATLLQSLGAADLTAVTALDDTTIQAALVAGNFGSQRIASRVMITGIHDQALPLPRSFLLLGQRYVIDSNVFSNVTYDRVPPTADRRMRMLPNPLDVAFAVLGANQALPLLKSDLDTFRYAPALASMRVLVDHHEDAFWGENLYNGWLGALRALGPTGGSQSGPFEVAATEPWSRRLMNTQLASWAELRHDTILYAKQSYSGGISCSFPDALVEPNPAFFDALAKLADKGLATLNVLNLDASYPGGSIPSFFTNLSSAAKTLKAMAEAQVAGTPFTDEQMMFINQAVSIQIVGCGTQQGVGWYPKLFYGTGLELESHPTIADVHTAPTDEEGNDVGWVLHVGTGLARMMVVTANTCDGPKAYVGLASSYFEDLTTGLKRLDDPTWDTALTSATPPADVSWMSDLVTH